MSRNACQQYSNRDICALTSFLSPCLDFLRGSSCRFKAVPGAGDRCLLLSGARSAARLKGREGLLRLLLLGHHPPKRRQETNLPLLAFGWKRPIRAASQSTPAPLLWGKAWEGRSRSGGAVASPPAHGTGTAAGGTRPAGTQP